MKYWEIEYTDEAIKDHDALDAARADEEAYELAAKRIEKGSN
jgi:hypothetical protein